MRATDGTWRIAILRDDEFRRLAGRLLTASVFVALAVALFLLARRAAGAFSAPLPILQLVATAAAAAIWAVAVRNVLGRNQWYVWLAAFSVLVLAVACSYPGTRMVDWLVWGCAIVSTVWLPTGLRVPAFRLAKRVAPAVELESASKPETVLQQLTRIRTEDGHDALRGTLVGEFAPGERQTTLHVAFCPPFERLPEVEFNLADDSDATVKLAQILHNGVQLDVRLAEASVEPTSVAIELFVTDADAN